MSLFPQLQSSSFLALRVFPGCKRCRKTTEGWKENVTQGLERGRGVTDYGLRLGYNAQRTGTQTPGPGWLRGLRQPGLEAGQGEAWRPRWEAGSPRTSPSSSGRSPAALIRSLTHPRATRYLSLGLATRPEPLSGSPSNMAPLLPGHDLAPWADRDATRSAEAGGGGSTSGRPLRSLRPEAEPGT